MRQDYAALVHGAALGNTTKAQFRQVRLCLTVEVALDAPSPRKLHVEATFRETRIARVQDDGKLDRIPGGTRQCVTATARRRLTRTCVR